MAKFLFVLSRGLEDVTRATRTFQFAKVAKSNGHEVNIFLVDDAAYWAIPGMADTAKAPTGDEMKPYIDFLVEQEVPFYVCTPCARTRLIDPENMIKGAQFSTADKLIEMAAESQVFTF